MCLDYSVNDVPGRSDSPLRQRWIYRVGASVQLQVGSSDACRKCRAWFGALRGHRDRAYGGTGRRTVGPMLMDARTYKTIICRFHLGYSGPNSKDVRNRICLGRPGSATSTDELPPPQ